MSKAQKTQQVMHSVDTITPPKQAEEKLKEPSAVELLQADLIVAKAVAYDALGRLQAAEEEYKKTAENLSAIERRLTDATRDRDAA